MRILFLGTPEFALPSLQSLLDWQEVNVLGLVTQPDRPAGRGKQLLQPPTKELALAHGLPVFQPERLSKAPEVLQAMTELKPDLLVTVAFGQILKKDVLEMAPYGVMNVHASLLPSYRGAAPINWALLKGEKRTGITTMFSDAGVDTGKMLLKRDLEIKDDMDAVVLSKELSLIAAQVLIETIKKLKEGSLIPQEQDEAGASYAPRLNKEMGNIDWRKSSTEIFNQVRALLPWPGSYSFLDGLQVKLLKVLPEAEPLIMQGAEPGAISTLGGKFLVACGADAKEALSVLELQPANKKPMSAVSFANGMRLREGVVFQTS